jgi:hypothetical protein
MKKASLPRREFTIQIRIADQDGIFLKMDDDQVQVVIDTVKTASNRLSLTNSTLIRAYTTRLEPGRDSIPIESSRAAIHIQRLIEAGKVKSKPGGR